MGKKKNKNKGLSFAELTGGRKKMSYGKKKLKKAAKYHLKEMKISKKKFKKMDMSEGGSLKKAHRKYRRDNADKLADILLEGRLKNTDRYSEKLQEYIHDGKLFDPSKKSHIRKIAKKTPALMAYTHIVDPVESDLVKDVMKKKVRKLSRVVGDKTAVSIAPLAAKADATKVLRAMLKAATEKDPSNFDAKEFFAAIRPKSLTKKEWRETIVTTVLGIRGHSNNALKDVVNYAINLLGDMEKDKIRRILRRYSESITAVQESGEKLNFLVTIKDLSDDPKIEKVLNNNPKIANVIGQL